MATCRPNAFGTYHFEGLPDGEYDIGAFYRIPDVLPSGARLVHENSGRGWRHSSHVFQPHDTDTKPDLTVTPTGLTPCKIDIVFPWPTLLLHGFVRAAGSSGPEHFEYLQPYLSGLPYLAQLQEPRKGVIPLVPDMGRGTYQEYWDRLSGLLPEIMDLFPCSTRFNVVAYSQGGLVARLLIHNSGLNENVEKVIQVATPNRGMCVAADAGHPEVSQTAMDQFNVDIPSGRGVPFYLLAGTLFIDFPFLENDCLQLDPPSDSVVSVSSVLHLESLPGYDVLGHSCVPALHASLRRLNLEALGILAPEYILRDIQQWIVNPTPGNTGLCEE
ncbi:MAG: hypothetical protein COU08_00255 [Candidatus Harrisonbacteria bacterium CG10_big_fil_rev_8_21_14_0_10_42_17]|uniref:DUF676 domain-containing protein n=1 Tax=Candidatus Harrisonbacteria bacterium CG10_big_fil_rev_8_21_14_0_10_42_17 TaxID=1974584 RepID=A0A2M6WJB4_9BACT|nr:MAG: hypothetical protein COU08_00255 [Candidatus Harrisonbacteria bacterium CG10_big_fil_rev_8_21_14_0_10_42_17]